jgi:hypothetical protein
VIISLIARERFVNPYLLAIFRARSIYGIFGVFLERFGVSPGAGAGLTAPECQPLSTGETRSRFSPGGLGSGVSPGAVRERSTPDTPNRSSVYQVDT